MPQDPPRCALTVAGSDSGGGAGVQADLKTFAALGVHGTCALTAVTAQNTTEVRGVVTLAPDVVRQQIETVLDDFPVRAVKTGMLATAAVVRQVAELAAAGRLPALVVDPVLVSTSGHRLTAPDAVEAYRHELLAHALVVTPNLRETAVLCDTEVHALGSLEARIDAARRIRSFGAGTVIVKGGHLTDSADDVVVGPDGVHVEHAERVITGNDHGTGCTLSAALAAHLARGVDLPRAVTLAKEFVTRALRGAAQWQLGAGHGPLDQSGWGTPP
jgi:hydroxymethylpyrimidine/phosphomethylpyrimidine kinase